MSKFEEIKNYLRCKIKDQDGIFHFLPEISEFQRQEINFHNAIHQNEIEIHQLYSLRNSYYHDYFKKWLYQLPKNSVILEIGAGSGYDLSSLVKKGYSVMASDISLESIKHIKNKIDNQYITHNNQIIYLVVNGENLPMDDNSVEATFMVASFHHFENSNKVIEEIGRVTKKNGIIILAMEPSRFMMGFTKLFSKFKKLRIHKGSSTADETHPGFSRSDLIRLVGDKLRIIKLKRVWLLCGFLHYGLEAVYRFFKLKKRITVPRFFEAFLIFLDEILLKIPFVNQLNWHWIVVIANRKS